MSIVTPAWIQAFSAAAAATMFCWGVYSVKEAFVEFLATVEENESRSRVNRLAIRRSECVQVPARPLSTGEEDSA